MMNAAINNQHMVASTCNSEDISLIGQTEFKVKREIDVLEKENFQKIQFRSEDNNCNRNKFKHPLFISLDGTACELLKKHNKVMNLLEDSIYDRINDGSLPGTILWTGTNAINKTNEENKRPTYAQEFLYGYKRYFSLFSDPDDDEEDDYKRKCTALNNENLCHKWKSKIPLKQVEQKTLKICRLCGIICDKFVSVKKNVVIKLVAVYLPITFIEDNKIFPLGLCQNCDDDLERCASFLMIFLNLILIQSCHDQIKCLTCNDSSLENLSIANTKILKKLIFLLQAIPVDLPFFYSGARYICNNCNSILDLHEKLLEKMWSTNLVFENGYHGLFDSENMKIYLPEIISEPPKTRVNPIRFNDNGVDESKRKSVSSKSKIVENKEKKHGFFYGIKNSILSVFRPMRNFLCGTSSLLDEEVEIFATNKQDSVIEEVPNSNQHNEDSKLKATLERDDIATSSLELPNASEELEVEVAIETRPDENAKLFEVENNFEVELESENLAITNHKLLNYRKPFIPEWEPDNMLSLSSKLLDCQRPCETGCWELDNIPILKNRFLSFEKAFNTALELEGLANLTKFDFPKTKGDLDELGESVDSKKSAKVEYEKIPSLSQKVTNYEFQKMHKIDLSEPTTSYKLMNHQIKTSELEPEKLVALSRKTARFLRSHRVEFDADKSTNRKSPDYVKIKRAELSLENRTNLNRKALKFPKSHKIKSDYRPSTSRNLKNYQKVPLEPIIEITKSTPLDSDDED